MKIKDIINEDGSAGASVSGAVASVTGNIFAVPIKRNMPRKRSKKESTEIYNKKDKHNVVEEKND
jgi:hypothetical protein